MITPIIPMSVDEERPFGSNTFGAVPVAQVFPQKAPQGALAPSTKPFGAAPVPAAVFSQTPVPYERVTNVTNIALERANREIGNIDQRSFIAGFNAAREYVKLLPENEG